MYNNLYTIKFVFHGVHFELYGVLFWYCVHRLYFLVRFQLITDQTLECLILKKFNRVEVDPSR